jgi:hypothetical protein
MGIFGKIKQFLGIGTIKMELDMQPTVDLDSKLLTGKLKITGKSDQTIKEIELSFDEDFSTGKGDDKSSSKLNWGKMTLQGFDIKKDEVKEIEFELPFSYAKSSNEAMADKGGVVGGLGKVGSFLDGEKQKYEITATASVKGVTLLPLVSKELKKAKK